LLETVTDDELKQTW